MKNWRIAGKGVDLLLDENELYAKLPDMSLPSSTLKPIAALYFTHLVDFLKLWEDLECK